jgi:hypothetical protein
MPPLSKAFSANAQEILDLALMAERLRSHATMGQSIRQELTVQRTRLFYEVAFLKLFASWETFLGDIIIRYLCGYTYAGQAEQVINGFARSLTDAQTRLLGNQSYVLLQNPTKIIGHINRLFQPGCRIAQVVSSFQQSLEDFANIRHRIAHDHQDARRKFDGASMRLAGRRFPGSRPGTLLRETTQFNGLNVRWLERIVRELEGITGQLSP